MNQDEIDSAISLLNSMKWPIEQTGYLMNSENDLPPYRILAKLLQEKQIHQEMTWNKAQCIDALGGIENVDPALIENGNIISQKIVQSIQHEIACQNQLINNLHDLIKGNDEDILQLLEEEENLHIQEQKKMFS